MSNEAEVKGEMSKRRRLDAVHIGVLKMQNSLKSGKEKKEEQVPWSDENARES